MTPNLVGESACAEESKLDNDAYMELDDDVFMKDGTCYKKLTKEEFIQHMSQLRTQ